MRHTVDVGRRWWLVVVLAAVAACSGTRGTSSGARSSTATAPTGPPALGFLSRPVGSPGSASPTLWSWRGNAHATLPAAFGDCCGSAGLAPNGQTAVIWNGHADVLVDTSGRVLARNVDGVWADDSEHLCNVEPVGPLHGMSGPAQFVYSDGAKRVLVRKGIGSYGPHGDFAVLACSASRHTAYVGARFIGTITSVVRIDLRTGAVSTPPWGRADSGVVAVSGDAASVLEQTRNDAEVLVASTGQVRAHLSRTLGATAISWNGNRVVGQRDGRIVVVDTRSGATVWQSEPASTTCPCIETEANAVARPESDDLALKVAGVHGYGQGEAALWLVPATGAPRFLRYPVATF